MAVWPKSYTETRVLFKTSDLFSENAQGFRNRFFCFCPTSIFMCLLVYYMLMHLRVCFSASVYHSIFSVCVLTSVYLLLLFFCCFSVSFCFIFCFVHLFGDVFVFFCFTFLFLACLFWLSVFDFFFACLFCLLLLFFYNVDISFV